VLLGVLAIVVMLVAPEGLWGRFSRRTGVVLFPIGYRVRPEGKHERRRS
jgi:branched-chain amino acid transport system permease protein